ncbi:distal basal body ring component protein [Asticcacaulis biprosthecium C19]|uniref:Flagella basal body P-ring formation protein FlgA n=1 Tax=Asticcacaulis biprosthecium C19 TaxID=715226 RepID=F4QPD8_9CAUL|nr:flagellar basal body P-ring formation chaperone FlgA [Asticcacaulis biprosthecium]EGF91196.1 distal basal body ring component protein [Asticcacaulis biprosthecium C19]
MKRFAFIALLALAIPAASHAATPMVLKASTSDGDGRITLGDLFDNAGSASDVTVGVRQGQTAVLDAGAVQSIAARNGAYWDNPRGLRRIIVTAGMDGTPSAVLPASGFAQPAIAIAPRAAAVRRGEAISVTWSSGGLTLTITGVAQKDAAVGDLIQIQNPSSKKMIDAVVIGSGRAAAGPNAMQTRNLLLSSR